MATVRFYQNATEVSDTVPAVLYNNVVEKDQPKVLFSAVKPIGTPLCTAGSHWSSSNLPSYLKIVNMVSLSGDSHGYLTVDDSAIASIAETTTIEITYTYGTSRICDFLKPTPIKTNIQITVESRSDPGPEPGPSPDPGPTPTPEPSPNPAVPPTNYPSVSDLVQLNGDVSISAGPVGGATITDNTLVRHLSAAWVDARTPTEYNRMVVDINGDIAHSMTVIHKPDAKTEAIGEYVAGSIQYEAVSVLPSYLTFEDYTTTDTGILHYIQSEDLGPNEEIAVGQVDNVIVRYRARYSSGVTVFGTLTLKVEFTNGLSATPTPADSSDDIGLGTWWVILIIVLACILIAAGSYYGYQKYKK